MRVTKIGAGFVGLVPGASFADFGHCVTPVAKVTQSSKIGTARLRWGATISRLAQQRQLRTLCPHLPSPAWAGNPETVEFHLSGLLHSFFTGGGDVVLVWGLLLSRGKLAGVVSSQLIDLRLHR